MDKAPFGWRLFLDLSLFQMKIRSLSWGWPLVVSALYLGFPAVVAALGALVFGRELTWAKLLAGGTEGTEPSAVETVVDSIAGILFGILLTVVLLLVAGATFRARNSVHASIDFDKIKSRIWTIAAAHILKSVAIVAASLLLILPGIWLASRLFYVQIAAADRGLGLRRSVAESWRISQPVQWHLTANLAFFVATIILSLALIFAIMFRLYLATPDLPIWVMVVVGSLFWGFASSEYAVLQATTYHLLREHEAVGTPSSDARQDA